MNSVLTLELDISCEGGNLGCPERTFIWNVVGGEGSCLGKVRQAQSSQNCNIILIYCVL